MEITWKRVKPLIFPESVDQLLGKTGQHISFALKSCILTNNGGRPVPNKVDAADGQIYDIKHLLSYNEEDGENIYLVIDYFASNYDGALIPFAIDSGSNYFCEKDGRIVVWTQEDECMVDIADSFEAFLAALHE